MQSRVLARSEPVLQAAAAALVILFAGCSATKVDTPSVFATGTAQLHLPAHWVAVTVEAQTTGPTAAQATAANAPLVRRLQDTLRLFGIPDSARTATFSVEPVYNGAGAQLRGYTATTSLELRIRALDRLAAVLDGALAAGATRIAQVQFYSDSADVGRRRAIQPAVADARLEAEAMAEAAGGSLGRLVRVSTDGPGRSSLASAVYRLDGVRVSPVGTVPDVRRDVIVSASVSATWAFVDRR